MVFIIAKRKIHRINGFIQFVLTTRRNIRFLHIISTRHQITQRSAAAVFGITYAVGIQSDISDVVAAVG